MKKSIRTGFIILLLLVFTLISCILSNSVKSYAWEGKNTLENVILPEGDFLKKMTLGYTNLFADLIWIRTLRYIFTHNISDKSYPELPRFFEAITSLDPNFKDMYRVGGEMIRELAKETDKSIDLLKLGQQRFPDDWTIAWELGRSYYKKGNVTMSTRAFENALRLPGAPEWLSALVAEGYYHMGEYQKSLAWWVEIARTTGTMSIRSLANFKARGIVSLMGSENIAKKCEEFYSKFHRIPDNPFELVQKGFMGELPEDPFGRGYIIDKKNLSVTSGFLYILLDKCLENINSGVTKYHQKHGKYPENFNQLKADADLSKNLPENPYGGEYIFDSKTKKFVSTKNFLAKIEIRTN